MKWLFPVEKGTDRWYFDYRATEDPMPDLLGVGLNAIPSPSEEEPLYLLQGQTLLALEKAEYCGRAFLVVHETLPSREHLEEKQKELSAKGWVRAEKPFRAIRAKSEDQ
ncbi:MAG TPA: hypothetical protein VMV03_09045 [Spirochaetia bacterium]|nr:hypothetical protein [Spirochaetia bacterium]